MRTNGSGRSHRVVRSVPTRSMPMAVGVAVCVALATACASTPAAPEDARIGRDGEAVVACTDVVEEMAGQRPAHMVVSPSEGPVGWNVNLWLSSGPDGAVPDGDPDYWCKARIGDDGTVEVSSVRP